MKLSASFALVALICGCKETPTRAWKDMNDAACDRDVTRFFSRVDKTLVRKHLMNRAQAAAEQTRVRGFLRDAALKAAEEEIDKGLAEWEDDIKKGEGGDWCQAQVLDEEPDRSVVHWSTPTGKAKAGRFVSYDGKLLLVELLE